MKKSNILIYTALAIVIIGVILQFMDGGLFGENPIPEFTKYNQVLFWLGIGIWSFGFIKTKKESKEESKKNSLKSNSEK